MGNACDRSATPASYGRAGATDTPVAENVAVGLTVTMGTTSRTATTTRLCVRGANAALPAFHGCGLFRLGVGGTNIAEVPGRLELLTSIPTLAGAGSQGMSPALVLPFMSSGRCVTCIGRADTASENSAFPLVRRVVRQLWTTLDSIQRTTLPV